MFDISDLRTETSQDLHFLLVLAQPAVVGRAVNLFLIDSGPLEKIMGHRENPQWKISEVDYRED